MSEIKYKTKLTPVRYPGGKSNAIKVLREHLSTNFLEYREPFFGGGSVGLYQMQLNPNAKFWINDLFYPVYCFWNQLSKSPLEMIENIRYTKSQYVVLNDVVGNKVDGKKIPSKSAEAGRTLHELCRKHISKTIENKDEFGTACLWYILNKLSYSGMSMIGSYAPLAWDQNFTDNCISNLITTHKLLSSVKELKITNLDYSELLKEDGEKVSIFLDPPYDISHNLYGDNGNMHEGFNHERFGELVKECKHEWLITYNSNEIIRNRFSEYKQKEWDLTYTMKAAKRPDEDKADVKYSDGTVREKTGKKGKELLIFSTKVSESL